MTDTPAIRLKPHQTIKGLLALLSSRGMAIPDRSRAENYLRRVGYYRLSGYWHPFYRVSPDGTREDQFVAGTTFQHALDLYVFDKRLRLILTDALGRVEIAVRACLAHQLGAKNPRAHLEPEFLHPNFIREKPKSSGGSHSHAKWLDKHDRQIRQAATANKTFVLHHAKQYDGHMPIWVSVELWNFGMLSHFYAGMRVEDQDAVARACGLSRRILASWLRAMNFVRNAAAHHNRLWNDNIADRPLTPRPNELADFAPPPATDRATARLYPVLCAIIFMMRQICPGSRWQFELRKLLNNFPQSSGRKLTEMGFPPGWENHPFWRATSP